VSLAMQPNLSEHTLVQRTRSGQNCINPESRTIIESFSTTGAGLLFERFTTQENGAFFTGWTIGPAGGDILATKDIAFTASLTSGSDSARVTANLVLFHKPLP
jgi:hypothetical protein